MTTSDSAPKVGVRATRQRHALSALLDELDEFRSAQDLHDELRRRNAGVGLTTVYRTLQSMTEQGTVDVLRTDTGESVFRRCSDDHHHHIVCRGCGYAVEIGGPEVEDWAHRVASDNGFTDVSHTVEIFGWCRDCTRERAARADGSGARDTGSEGADPA